MPIATCLCQTVEITVDEPPNRLTSCNCSLCRRYGALWTYHTRRSARVTQGADKTGVYRRAGGRNAFHFCRTCACLLFYERPDATG